MRELIILTADGTMTAVFRAFYRAGPDMVVYKK